MAQHEVEIIISKSGEVKVHVSGVKGKGCMVSGELIDALNNSVAELLDKAAARTKANKRATVKASDL